MSISDLSGQIALITGATGGIGQALCRTLASHGCDIAMHYMSDQLAAIELLQELREKYSHRKFGTKTKFVMYRADLANYDEVRELHQHVVESLGPPTILINNAGSYCGHSNISSIDSVPIEIFEKTWRINCGSAYLLTQLCMPTMEGEGWGRILFISSVAAFTGGVVGPHYASSKSALHGLVHWCAQRYARKGITVNGVAPAMIEGTKMLPGKSEELSSKIPLGRLGTPDEIAETVLWMVKTAFLTNKVIGIDGGILPQ